MKTFNLSIKGMQDSSDAEKVDAVLHDVWGIRKAEVNLETGQAGISYDENAGAVEDFKQAVHELGFEVDDGTGTLNEGEGDK
ncbi:heavy-metal-associated domain-containing protein [Tuberibacillus sp. Marseille-P3662]|uniref:heavy-metal-associated domain-containing protein n=1 Tax=Tuberibacillus sp. Marseille-P3662 TaxID=1965358 RepID=UPI000A1CBC93|nr:heavy-metal-associated domain-containing protein [Tuberibacillus sp. Marseille-P3662]